jgi:hypothetical protein
MLRKLLISLDLQLDNESGIKGELVAVHRYFTAVLRPPIGSYTQPFTAASLFVKGFAQAQVGT